jgi:alpha-galactosidase
MDHLPADGRVEVPVVVDRNGPRPCHVGKLPPERAAQDGDRARVYRAAMLDRHVASTLSIAELRAMADELIAAQGKALPFA